MYGVCVSRPIGGILYIHMLYIHCGLIYQMVQHK